MVTLWSGRAERARSNWLPLTTKDPLIWWPKGIESFEPGSSFEARIAKARFSGNHGIGAHEVHGRERVDMVTWIAGEVEGEGAEADDYPSSQAVIRSFVI